ncbi:MAG TPA: FAD-binding oxidoreductase [archaeon]|nr:FAD-binding oxidoreductase [archaeon]
MKETAEVVVVGGGIAGASVAYHLGLMGKSDTVLLEQETLGYGSTSKSNSIVERQLLNEFDILLRVKSFETLTYFFREKGVVFTPIGYIRITSAVEDIPKYHESVRIQRSLGVTDSRVLQPGELKKILPFLRIDDLTAALYCESDGVTDGSQLMAALAREADNFGVEIALKTRVEGISRVGSHRFIIKTNRGNISCRYIVNAAGAWSSKIGDMAGVRIPVKPARRQYTILRVPYDGAGQMPFFIDMKSRLYMHGTGGRGHEVFCGIHRDADIDEPAEDPDKYNQGQDFEFVERIARTITDRAPGLNGASVKGGVTGLYEITPDSRPILGEHPELPGFFNCNGFSGYGIQLSPIAGKLTAEMIAKAKPVTVADISPLRIDRFKTKKDYTLF